MRELRPGRAVAVRVPASTANLGPGFDAIGLALGIWDDYVAEVTGDRLVIEVEGEGAAGLTCDESHLVHRSMVRAWDRLGVRPPAGLVLRCRNAIPHSRGLGSSASAIVAGVALAQALAADDAGAADLVFVNDLAGALEGHPDNSSASVYGGMTLSWTDDLEPERVRTVHLRVSPEIVPVVLLPAMELSTASARAILPATVPLGDAARGAARAALLVEAMTRRPDLLLAATRDWLHQEARRGSYPASMELVDTLRGLGHAAAISGAGPSVIALATQATAPELLAWVRSSGRDAAWQALTPEIPMTGVSVGDHPGSAPLGASSC